MRVSLALALCGPPAAPVAPPAPQATVELRLTSVDEGDAKLLEELLRRRLTDRLLQDGYRLLPEGEAADVAVWVHVDRAQAQVEARGARPRRETIAAGDPEIVVLEILQLTSALVDEAQPAQASSLRAVELEGDAPDAQWRERLQAGLLERGFALTNRATSTDLRLCVASQQGSAVVHATSGARGCDEPEGARVVPSAEAAELTHAHLLDAAVVELRQRQEAEDAAVVQAVLAAAAVERPRAPVSTSVEVEEPSPSAGPSFAAEPQPKREGSVALAAHGGVIGRTGGADGTFGVRLRAGRRRGVGGGASLWVVPSSEENVSVVELMPAGLVDWRLGFGEHGLVSLGAFAGLHVHTYRWDVPSHRGRRLAPSAGTTVRVGRLGARGLLAFGGVRAGWSGGRWVHVFDGDTVWQRSSLLVAVELGVGWELAWRRRR